MKYHQLKAFVTAAEEGSIRAAARRLNVSPAALTKAVKELEIALGVSLVVRTARGVQLTAFGQQLQVRARLIVAEMQRARDDIEQAQGAMTGSVAAAITPAAAVTILPDAFRAFRRRYPVARVNLVEGFRASRCRACTTVRSISRWPSSCPNCSPPSSIMRSSTRAAR